MIRQHHEEYLLMEQCHGASKTPLGRVTTKNKPALELIRTPQEMAELQDEEVSLKEGYHLGKVEYILLQNGNIATRKTI